MKHTILAILFSSSLFACKKNETEPIKKEETPKEVTLIYNDSLKPIVFEYTSTGCNGCGSWGKPTFYSIINEFQDKVIPLAVHIKYGDPMISITSETIASNRYGQNYTPQIWVNDTNGVELNGGMINGAASIAYMRKLINNASKNNVALVAGAIISKNETKSEVKLGIKLLSGSNNNDYYLGCYLMKDGFVYNQTGSLSNPTTHNYVIKQSSVNPFGIKVETSNDTFEYKHQFEDKELSDENYYVVILWQKQGSRYIPLGGHKF